MIHGFLQFTLRIAFRCVLHRCESQEIRCQKLFFNFYIKGQAKRIEFVSVVGSLAKPKPTDPSGHIAVRTKVCKHRESWFCQKRL